jgi:hypothetical protein
MPLTPPSTSGPLLAAAVSAAVAAARAPYIATATARGGALTPAEQAQMATDVENARWTAVIAFLQTNTVVATPAGPGALT